jgi:3-mercaptopyruvate sulfurtransferase SseA
MMCLVMGLLLGVGYGQTFKRKPKNKTAVAQPTPKPAATLPEEEVNTDPDRITTHELKRKLDAKADILILDNRTGHAWIGSQVKIKGAIHLPMQELMTKFDKLPKNKEIITYCT